MLSFTVIVGSALAIALYSLPSLPTSIDKPAPLTQTSLIHATPQKLWWAFTTREGQESWQVAHADIDLQIGGLMRTQYAKEGVLGDENTINNKILSFDPEHMLSFRIVNPPARFPFKKAAEKVWTVVYFEPVTSETTRVTVTMLGWEEDDESRKMREFFDGGNRWVLDKLKSYFEPKPQK